MNDPFSNDFDGMSLYNSKGLGDASSYEEEYTAYNKESFEARMLKESVSSPVRNAMAEALDKTSEAEHSTIFVATHGNVAIDYRSLVRRLHTFKT